MRVKPYFNVFFLCLSLRYALLELGTDPKKWHKNFKVLAIMMKPKPIKNELMKTWKVWQYRLWSFQQIKKIVGYKLTEIIDLKNL